MSNWTIEDRGEQLGWVILDPAGEVWARFANPQKMAERFAFVLEEIDNLREQITTLTAEADQAKEEIASSRQIIDWLTARVASQSELLTKRAERKGQSHEDRT